MDAYEATRIVFSRIQALDPENAAKIMGILLIQDHGEKEMIRLAFGPETLLHSVILKARRDLGLLLPSSSSSAAAAAAAATTPPSPLPSPSPSPFLLARQTSFRNSTANSSSGCLSPSSWAPQALPFSRSSSSEQQEMVVEGEQQIMLNNDYLLQEQLSFLNEQQQQQIGGAEGGVYWGDQHQRVCLSPDGSGWKPCLYFARGFCKNGSSCRFLHGPAEDISAAAVEQQCQELMLMRSKSQRLMSSAAVAAAAATAAAAAAAAFPYSPTGSSAANKGFNLMMQQSESQRSAAVAAAAMMLESENKFMGRVRMERSDFAGMVNPGSRQIYLTFPADSTFREEDVSNYFSIYGPVQDVRIPYQQKRMFGFVTFVYPETVRLILAKGNPHFVCDARVLVKPYKEKGKVPDKKLHQGERVDFAGCGTPTGLDDSRDPYDLQPLASSRLLYGSNGQEALLRRKMEEQQAAAELQQAIEMQGRRFMGLQLLDLKNISISSPSSNGPLLSPLATIPSSTTFINKHHNNTGPVSDGNGDGNGSERSSSGTSQDETTGEDKSLSPASGNASAISNADNKQQKQLQQPAVKSDQRAIATVEPNANEDIHFQESAGAEIHNLPDSPFASPTKSSFLPDRFALAIDDEDNGNGNGNGHLIASSLLSPSSPLENVASFKSCYFQMPRYSSGHGAVGL